MKAPLRLRAERKRGVRVLVGESLEALPDGENQVNDLHLLFVLDPLFQVLFRGRALISEMALAKGEGMDLKHGNNGFSASFANLRIVGPMRNFPCISSAPSKIV